MEKKQISRTYQYDPLNRLVSVSGNNERTRVYTYDPAGNRTMTTILEPGEVSPPVPQPGPGAAVPPPAPIPALSPHEVRNAATTSTCPGCGRPIVPGNKFCRSCGAPVGATAPVTPGPPSPAVCTGCGNPIRPGAKFCAKCGKKLT